MSNDHLPIIHGNGTPSSQLVTALADTLDALHDAGDKLKLTAPNGRDYYPQPGRMEKAEEIFLSRMGQLRSLIREMEADMLTIDAEASAKEMKR